MIVTNYLLFRKMKLQWTYVRGQTTNKQAFLFYIDNSRSTLFLSDGLMDPSERM